MITNLSRLPNQLFEGFTGEYIRQTGEVIHFSLCLNNKTLPPKAAKETKRQTLIEAQKRSGLETSPQVYAMADNLDPVQLSAGIKHALSQGDPSAPVYIELPNKELFANSCEALGMSRKSLIELASSAFLTADTPSKQVHGGFHRLYEQLVKKPHLPISIYGDMYGNVLEQSDEKAHRYAASMSFDLKRLLPRAQRYNLEYQHNLSVNHVHGELGRCFAPHDITAIETKGKFESEGNPVEIAYTFIMMPPQSAVSSHDFDVVILSEIDKEFYLWPVMFAVHPNEKLNDIDVKYRPFLTDETLQQIVDENENFGAACDHAVFVLTSSLEWINSPTARRVDHSPKQKPSSKTLVQQFADGERPFFSSIEVKIPSDQDVVPPIHRVTDVVSSVKSEMGLQSVGAHFQRYGPNKEWKLKRQFERGNPARGVSVSVGVGREPDQSEPQPEPNPV